MIKVFPIFFKNDLRNYGYLIFGRKNICIDPFEGELVANQLGNERLDYIINTHNHFDHIQGNGYLIKNYGATIFKERSLELDSDYRLDLIDSPGHTMDHQGVILRGKRTIEAFFSGDTLFNGGVGNCKNGGNVELLFETMARLLELLPDESLLYPGHDYFNYNLAFAKSLKLNLDNKVLQSGIKTIGDEKTYNPFLRLFRNDFLQQLQRLGIISRRIPRDAFLRLRSLRDNF